MDSSAERAVINLQLVPAVKTNPFTPAYFFAMAGDQRLTHGANCQL